MSVPEGQCATAMYFAYDLPNCAPEYLNRDKVNIFNQYVSNISSRMEKLEEALDITGLDGETFSEYAKNLFDTWPARFDAMTSDELAEYVLTVHDGSYQAPKRMDWPNAITVVDTAFVREKEWEAIRRLSIGGSEASVVMGSSAYSTQYKLYQDKVWNLNDSGANKIVFDRGHAMEPRVIKAFCDTVGAEVVPETRMFRSKKYPHCSANIDAIVRFPGDRLYVFEAKTTIGENYDAWAGDKIPATYIQQTRQYPAVLDDDRILGTYIGCLFTVDYSLNGYYLGSSANVGQFVSRFVDRDKTLEDNQLAEEETFFNTYVAEDVEPPFLGKPDKEVAILSELIGPADRKAPVVDLDSEDEEAITGYLDLQEQKKAAEAQVSGYKEAMSSLSLPLIQRLGTAVEGRLPADKEGEYYEVKYAPRSKTSVNYDVLKNKYPEAYNECVTVDPDSTRVFSVKVKKEKKKKAA